MLTFSYLAHQMERMTERSEGNEWNEGEPDTYKAAFLYY